MNSLRQRLRGLRLLPPDDVLGWTPYAWLICLPIIFVQPWLERSVWQWLICIAAAILFLATYFRGYWVRGRRLIPIIVIQLLLGAALSPINVGAYVFFIYAASFAGQLDRTREALRWVGVIYAIGLVTMAYATTPGMLTLDTRGTKQNGLPMGGRRI